MGGGAQPVIALARAAGAFLAKPDGPRVATIDFGGWDSHANQIGEYSPLTRNLRLLDRTVTTLKSSLGDVWKHTAVLIVTEFGRTGRDQRLARHRPRHCRARRSSPAASFGRAGNRRLARAFRSRAP
jgi:hypothetical protein